jgi:hypothetical protein
MTNLVFRVNKTSTDSNYATAPANFKTAVPANDSLIFSAGSDVVADGLAVPTQAEINRAATQLGDDPIEVAKYFLASAGDNLLYQIFNAGSVDKRYVFCASFDGATASEPQLEAWDDSTMLTHALDCLGGTTPANSYYRAISTTGSTPGASWTGTPLAGSGSSNIILLNNGSGALSAATDLYFNFKILIPGGLTTPQLYQPILVVVYTTN